MTKIAFLDSWLEDAVDGSGTAVAIGGLARTLRQQGYVVDRVVPTQNCPSALAARRVLYNQQLPQQLQNHPYDLIIGFDIDGFRVANQLHVPYICSVKGVIAEELQNEEGMVRRLLWAFSRLERLNARRAPLVITTSRYCQRRIHAHYGVPLEKIEIVPEGIDLARWATLASVPREPWTVLCVARQYRRKHIDDLIKAWPEVMEAVPQAQLVIIGDGPEHDGLRALTSELKLEASVRLLGPVASDVEVQLWYQRSSVFCLPSVQEGFGIVFLEAMASGLPIVSCMAAAIPEVVPQRKAGILVEPRRPSAVAAALIELLQHPHLREQYGVYGQHHVQQYAWSHVTQRLLEVVTQRFGALGGR